MKSEISVSLIPASINSCLCLKICSNPEEVLPFSRKIILSLLFLNIHIKSASVNFTPEALSSAIKASSSKLPTSSAPPNRNTSSCSLVDLLSVWYSKSAPVAEIKPNSIQVPALCQSRAGEQNSYNLSCYQNLTVRLKNSIPTHFTFLSDF